MKQNLKFAGGLLLLFLSTFSLFSQAPGGDFQRQAVVTGRVIDADNGNPLEFATLVLQSTDNPEIITGGITDDKGNFRVEARSGRYDIRVEFISYKTFELKNQNLSGKKDLGTISLNLDVSTLEAVEITAERTTVEIKLDKKVYNVGKDLTNAGATISDALNNVPSVAVDIDGGISLRGNQNVRILINGRPSALAGFGSTDALQQLPADAIERIEVITSPSARYDAEGTAGILNIVLKRDKTLGFNGSVQLNGGYPERFQGTSNLNYRTRKFNFFNTIGYRYQNSPGRASNDNIYNPGSSNFDRIIEERDWDRTSKGLNLNIGTEYFITEQTSITASFFTRFSDGVDLTTNLNDRFYADGSFDQTVSTEEENEEDRSYQTSLNFRHEFNKEGHNLTVDLQYSVDKEDVTTPIEELIYSPQESLIRDDDVFEIQEQKDYLIQTDYVLPLGENARFEAGYRGSFENSETDYLLQGLQLDENLPDFGEVVIDFGLTNTFNFEQNINAFYTQYGNKFGKFSFLTGLRIENTRLIGSVDFNEEEVAFPFDPNFDKNFLGLFPTLNVTWEIAESENISLGYNRRINRPRSWQINPFPSQSSRTNIFQGNPSLNPAYANTFDLGYLKRWDKLTLTTSVYFQQESDSFEWITEETGEVTSDNIPILRRTPINLSSEERYGGEAAILWSPAKWMRINTSANVFKFVKSGDYNGTSFGASNLSWFARMNAKVTLPGKIDWQTNAFYRGPSENAQSRTEGLFFLNLAFARDILNDNATLSFNVNDVFNSGIRRSVSETPRVTSNSETQWRVRQFQLGFVYRFNQSKRDARRNRGRDDFEEEGGF